MNEYMTLERLRKRVEGAYPWTIIRFLRADIVEVIEGWDRDCQHRDAIFRELERANSFYERLAKERDFLLDEFLSEQEEVRKVCEEKDRLREALEIAWRWIDEDCTEDGVHIRADFMEDMNTIRRVLAATEKRDD